MQIVTQTKDTFIAIIGGVDAPKVDHETAVARRTAAKLARSRRINAEKHDRRVMLKIKLKSLADEARCIRREEQLRQGGWLRLELRQHRLGLRTEARATVLAYTFVRGFQRSRCEKPWVPIVGKKNSVQLTREAMEDQLREKVRAMVKKYSAHGDLKDGSTVADEWFTGA